MILTKLKGDISYLYNNVYVKYFGTFFNYDIAIISFKNYVMQQL